MPQNPQGQVPSTPQIAPTTSTTPTVPPTHSRAVNLATPAARIKMYNMPLEPAFKAAGDIMQEQNQELELRHKYANVNNEKEENKIEAMKDISLDPKGFTNRADSIAFSYNRWRYIAADAQQKNPSKLTEIATNYFKKEIKPYYKELGIPDAMPLELWLKQAYNPQGALRYNLEDSYHGAFTTGIYRGLHDFTGELETLGKTLFNMIGTSMKGVSNLKRDAEINISAQHPEIARTSEVTQWHDNLVNARATDEKAEAGKGFFERAQTRTQSLAVTKDDSESSKSFGDFLGRDSKLFQHYADEDEFWSHINPSKGYKDIVTSGVVELLATLPIFGAVRSGNKILAEGGLATLRTTETGAKVAHTLTEVLNATPKGQFIARTLGAGGEGLGYGVLTRPNEDKSQSWKDALAFMVGENIFHYAGQKIKLRDVLVKSGDEEAVHSHDTAMELSKRGAENGERLATPAEKRQAYVEKHANDMAQVGAEGVRTHYIQAAEEIVAEEAGGTKLSEVEAKHAKARKSDPAGAVPVQTAKGFIRDFLNGRKLTELSPEAKSDLTNQVIELIADAENHLDRNSEAIRTANATSVKIEEGGPNAKMTLDHIRETVMRENQEAGIALATKPEEVEAMVQERYKKAQARAAAQAEARSGRDAERTATETAETRTEGDKLIRKSGQETSDSKGKSVITKATEGETRYKPRNAEASHNVSYSNYLVYLKKTAGGTTNAVLTKFYAGMDAEDFEKELETWMYPKALKDEGLYFEHEYTREGKQNPNFLAFMLNYADQMPVPMAKKLSSELEESLKFENHFKGSKVTDTQKWHYALQMYNHVDTFLNSSAFMKRGEKNIFRSTQSDLLNPTGYQVQLLDEMHKENLKLVSEMFPNAREKTAARFAYTQLAGDLNDIFMRKPTPASATAFRKQSELIANWMTMRSEGTLDRWRF